MSMRLIFINSYFVLPKNYIGTAYQEEVMKNFRKNKIKLGFLISSIDNNNLNINSYSTGPKYTH